MWKESELREDRALIGRENIVWLEQTMSHRRKYCEANGHRLVDRNTYGVKRVVCTTCGFVHDGLDPDAKPSGTMLAAEGIAIPTVKAPPLPTVVRASPPPLQPVIPLSQPVESPMFEVHKG